MEQYVELLVDALSLFYQNDAEALFSDRLVHEQAMVGCIARYAWCLRRSDPRFSSLLPDVDVEYDKMDMASLKTLIDITRYHNCQNGLYESCGGTIKKKILEKDGQCKKCEKRTQCDVNDCEKELTKDEYNFRPDLIIHKRNENENGLVVEFKKIDHDFDKKKNEINFDIAKIRACTCANQNFVYKVGAVVLLCKDCAHVKIFNNSVKKDAFWVDKDGCHKYNRGNEEFYTITK